MSVTNMISIEQHVTENVGSIDIMISNSISDSTYRCLNTLCFLLYLKFRLG